MAHAKGRRVVAAGGLRFQRRSCVFENARERRDIVSAINNLHTTSFLHLINECCINVFVFFYDSTREKRYTRVRQTVKKPRVRIKCV